jgi:hypothetical protein
MHAASSSARRTWRWLLMVAGVLLLVGILSLQGRTVDLDPQLTLQVDGTLAGSLIGSMVPEVPGANRTKVLSRSS